MHFEGGASKFRNVLRKYAVEYGFHIKFIKNDSVRVTAVCAMNKSKSCTWSVHRRKLEANGFFYLRKWNSEHICGVAVRTSTHPLVGSDLVADIVSECVQDRPLTRPTEVILDLKQDYGLDITYCVAWLSVEKARGELFDAHSISFDQLRWYSNAVLEHNPGTYINIEYDDHTQQFTRYFISFKACIDWGWRYGEMCSNAAESFNSWVREARNLPITRMVDSIWTKLMRQMVKRRDASQTWTGTICPKMESRLKKAFNEASIFPISTVEQPSFNLDDFIIKPPAVKRPLGRPKKKRILSKGEHVQQIRCGRCGRMGNHNRKTCNEPI
ncbi:hypothetical protein ACSBR1_041125 [Camellia fascicularis]